MLDIQTDDITVESPAQANITTVGATVTFSLIMWVLSIAAAGVVQSGSMSLPVYVLLLTAASTSTVAAIVICCVYFARSNASHNHSAIIASIGRLAAEVEQVSAKLDLVSTKVDRIDPWQIYTAVAADLLGREPGRN